MTHLRRITKVLHRSTIMVVLVGVCFNILAASTRADSTSAHWAYKKPVEPAMPPVAHQAWVKSPVDAFILAKIEAAGLTPAPPADRRTLVRRAYFDLIGLPPTPEDVDAFVADTAPDAFAKVVDKLLADPRYGERWGRYWLDVARYSDTKGYVFLEERRYPYAYTYRDYVIRSFNEDKPYDRFLIEQIAADLLPLGDDKRPLAAMGFLTLGRRFLNSTPDIVDDRLDVICRGTMGMTIGCARCHNHKFDPIPTKDYYSLYSIFNNSPDSKDPPLVGEPEHDAAYAAFENDLGIRQAGLDAYLKHKFEELVPPLRSAKSIAAYLLATRLDHVDNEAFFAGKGLSPFLFHRWKGYVEQAGRTHDRVFAAWRAYAEIKPAEFAAKSPGIAADLAKNDPGSSINPLVLKMFADHTPASLEEVAEQYGKLLSSYDKLEPLADANEESLRLTLHGEGSPVNVSLADVKHLFKRDLLDHVRDLQNNIDAFKASNLAAPPRAMTLEDSRKVEPQHVFLRGNAGNWGEEVKPHFLTCLSGENPALFTHGSGRLEFAQAIASKGNPLTARVMVNRVWLHHFGFGIVQTPSDFGTRSDLPTHPKLLDYLALRFMDSNWSIKSLQRQIMLTSTYQAASDASAKAEQKDPRNLLLSHFNRQRLDFESTRDAVLAVGGKMDAKMYGRSVDVTTEPFSTRRSVYASIDRQNLPGLFRNFDFASPDATCPRRFVTTVPQQALFMMNSPFFLDQVKNVLQRLEISAETDSSQKITRLYRLLFDRLPTPDEIALGTSFIAMEEQQSHNAIVWRYGYGEYDEAAHQLKKFKPLPTFKDGAWQGGPKMPDPRLVFASLTAGGGHPGTDPQHAVVRRWISPIDGIVKISGTLSHKEARGDGVRGRIVNSQSGELASWNVFQSDAQTALEKVVVKKGDTIDFIVDCRGEDSFDSFLWSPVVRAANNHGVADTDAPEEWNAATNFGGPEKDVKSLSSWEKYVQVLMESNEFVFVD